MFFEGASSASLASLSFWLFFFSNKGNWDGWSFSILVLAFERGWRKGGKGRGRVDFLLVSFDAMGSFLFLLWLIDDCVHFGGVVSF